MRFSITMNWSDSLIGGQEQNWGFAHCLHCNAHALLQIHTERATEREREREIGRAEWEICIILQ